MSAWHITLDLQDLKFSAAHFVAFEGFREPLHGHNYTVGARIGSQQPQADGYVVDFGDVKRVLRQVVKPLNSRTLLPSRSNVLQIQQLNESHLEIVCEGARMVLPSEDCVFLPIVHTTAEEIAEYIGREVVAQLGEKLQSRDCQFLEIKVSERPGQAATCMIPLTARPQAVAGRLPRPCMVPVSSESDEPGERAFQLLLQTLPEEEAQRMRTHLQKTPARAAKAFREMTAGLRVDPRTVVGDAIFEVSGAHDLVVVQNLPFHSVCEHHLLPFSGLANIAYFPNGRVLGLSKFARILEVFARRLQLQERLGAQLCDFLEELLRPKAVAVKLEAHHSCMSHRGANVPSTTQTTCLRGPQKDDPQIREQLLSGLRPSRL